MLLGVAITPAFVVLAAVGGAVSTAAGIAVRRLYKKVTHLEAQVNTHAEILDSTSDSGETQA